MARTKKELKDQAPAEEQVVSEDTALEDKTLRPDPGGEQEGISAGGLSDLELAHTGTLDPDASQTGTERKGMWEMPPEPDLQLNPDTGDGISGAPSSQTDPEPEQHAAGEDGIPQTETELTSGGQPPEGEPAAEDSAFDGADAPGSVTPPFYMVPPETGAPAAEAADAGKVGEADPEDPESGMKQAEDARPRLRMPRQRGPRVVSIDAERTVETENDKLRNDLLDLVESFKGKKILTGTIQGVERLASNPEICYAVTYHGDFKIIIPVLDAIEEPEDYRDQPKGDVLHYLLNKRLGAEVDYIVKRIDQEGGVVAASRLEAMALKRREYYFRTDRDGNYQIYEGIRAEARVVSVIRAGIFVDLFGAECYIPLRELSYQRWMDAASHYQPGQRVLVKVLEVDRSDRNRPRVTASVKQASENPYEKALKKYAVGNRYVGTVSMVDLSGVFVSLDGGIDCLCTHPKRGRPPRGARVTVRILGINNETNRIWGVITHMSTTR